MQARRILIAGDTLFAEMLVQLLANNPVVEVVGIVPDLEAVRPLLAANCPDALIYASRTDENDAAFARFLTDNPDLPILCTDINASAVKIFVSQQVQIHSSNDLLAAIAALPKRS